MRRIPFGFLSTNFSKGSEKIRRSSIEQLSLIYIITINLSIKRLKVYQVLLGA